MKPLCLVHNIQAAMNDERIHLSRLSAESSYAIPALFRGTEFEFKERVVAGAYDTEVI